MAFILSDNIALDRESVGWIKKQTVFGTEVKPAAANQFLIAGEGSIVQQQGFIEDAQRRNTHSALKRFGGRFEAGRAEIPIYIKPSGTLDVPPEASEFLEGLFGREVITASTKVEYLLSRVSDIFPSYTLWVKNGHFVYRCIGLIVEQGTFPLRANNSPESLSQVRAICTFAEMRWTGTDLANETIPSTPAQTDLTVEDARKFTVGSYIQKRDQSTLVVDDNSGAGFQVTAVNYTTNVLTISPGITDVNTGDQIEPWTPANAAEVGDPIHGRLGAATLGGVTLPLLSGEISLVNNFKVLNEEKNGLQFANRFLRRIMREVRVRAEVYFDANTSRYFHSSRNQVQANLVFPWGDTATKRFTVTVKNVEFNTPAIAGGEEKRMTLEGKGFATSAFDDELAGLFD